LDHPLELTRLHVFPKSDYFEKLVFEEEHYDDIPVLVYQILRLAIDYNLEALKDRRN
jgi:hypothetical protein